MTWILFFEIVALTFISNFIFYRLGKTSGHKEEMTRCYNMMEEQEKDLFKPYEYLLDSKDRQIQALTAALEIKGKYNL